LGFLVSVAQTKETHVSASDSAEGFGNSLVAIIVLGHNIQIKFESVGDVKLFTFDEKKSK